MSNQKRNGAFIILRRRRGGRNWVPMSTWEERQYRDYINTLGDWRHQDGAWRETRNPTDAEIDVIDGGAQTVDFGEHTVETYEEIPTRKPRYVAYLMTDEDSRHRLGAKKCAKRKKREKA